MMRLEDFARGVGNIDEAREIVRQMVSKLSSALDDHAQQAKVPTLLVVLPASRVVSDALLPDLVAANEGLAAHARSLKGVTLVAVDDISGDCYDKVGDELAHSPFTEAACASVAMAITRQLRGPSESIWQGALRDASSLQQAYKARGARSRTLPEPAVMPSTETERTLLELWQTILGIEALGVEDDYFALGGTSLMAARLFAEISARFAVRLPLSAILESATVRALSRRLDPAIPSSADSLVVLRPGGPRTLFFVHDGKGETLLYRNLARRMPTDLAIIGIGPRRLAGVPVAHARIEDMAEFYIAQVRNKQSKGPYLFAGMCAGGVIAYEMASQLVRAGEPVELVALLDAPTPQAPKKAYRITKQRLGRLKQVVEQSQGERTVAEHAKAVANGISHKLKNALVWEVRQRANNVSERLRFRLLRELLSRNVTWPAFLPPLSAHEILNCAQARYTPKPLAISSIVLARAKSGEAADTPYTSIYADKTLGWSAVASNLKVIDVEGGHSSMLQETFVESLAQGLTPYVQQKPG
jgi:thioesterase domain-containing protein